MYRTQDNGAPGSPVASSPDEAKRNTGGSSRLSRRRRRARRRRGHPPVKQKKAPRIEGCASSPSARSLSVGAGVASWFGYDYGRSAASRCRPTTPMCRLTTRRSPQKSPVMSPAFRSPTTPTFTPATLSPPSTMATIGSPSIRRVRRSRPRRRPSRGWDIKSPRRKPPSSRQRRSLSPPRRPPGALELELNRQNLLVARDASSRQLQEQAQANRDQAVAGVRGRAGRNRFGGRQCRTCSRASSRKRSPRSTNSRRRSPRPSAICHSPSSARRSTA